jgi:hypothetical protein
MLAFHVAREGDAIEIDCDAPGVAVLLRTLADLIAAHASHQHLRGLGAGGRDLDEEDSAGRKAVSEVIINYAEGDS